MNPILGRFENPNGYDLGTFVGTRRRWLFWKEKIYSFHLDPDNPLTYVRKLEGKDVERIQPDRNFLTDLATTPPPLHYWRRYRPDFVQRSALFHDSACEHHGAYFSVDPRWPAAPYEFRAISSDQANDYLLEMATIEAYVFRKLPWEDAVKHAMKFHWAVQKFGQKW